MTDYRELNALAKDSARARTLAQYLLKLADIEWTDWELDFLEDRTRQEEELSTRQAEKLIELRDASVLHSKVEGFVLKILLEKCVLYGCELGNDYDIEMMQRLKASGQTSFRRRDAARILRCAREIGELEPHQGWTLDETPALVAALQRSASDLPR
jgi:hypothetical protein